MRKALLISIMTISYLASFGQFCTPNSLNWCCGFGITNVTFNTINNNSADGSAGFEDFTSIQTSVFQGQNYVIGITTNVPTAHDVRVWIDFNNDTIFDPVNELVFSADSVLTSSGTVFIPSTTVLNTTVRMRVSADYTLEPAPTPCSDLERGQAEDYSIEILPNSSPPVPDFTANKTVTCDGVVQFSDQSTNIPTGWLWDFGDATSSNQPNPTHTYTSSGNYTVKLTADNTFGIDSVIKTNYITVNLAGAIAPASCSPVTTAACCGYGIYNVTFNSISNATDGGTDSYQDYSCEHSTSFTQGVPESIQINTGSVNPEDLKIWIDLNNDSILDNTTELVFTSINSTVHSGNITVGAGAVLNTPVRMRISSDFLGSPLTPCYEPQWGQVEDYAVTIQPNATPPVADFSANITVSCGGTISFTDWSTGLPTAWLWEFGNGDTDTVQNPVYTYPATGIYTVKLTAYNSFGANTMTKVNYINIVSTNPGPIPASCSPVTTSYCCDVGIYNVLFNTINKTSPDGVESYQDYSCEETTTVSRNASYNIDVITGPTYEENVRVWIDYNNDGSFNNATELAFSSDNMMQFHSGTITIPGTAVQNTSLRMRVASDFAGNFGPFPCADVTYGQMEDYSVVVDTSSGVQEAGFNGHVSIFPNPTSNHLNIAWDSEDAKELLLTLYNSLGQEVFRMRRFSVHSLNYRLDLSTQPKGVYFLNLGDGRNNVVKKVVLQ